MLWAAKKKKETNISFKRLMQSTNNYKIKKDGKF